MVAIFLVLSFSGMAFGGPMAGHTAKSETTGAVLIPDSVDNNVNHRIVITFERDSAWAASVFEIAVNDRVAHFSYYSVNDDSIVLLPDLFTLPGEYQVRVRATGYPEVFLTQLLLEGGEWRNEILSVNPGDNSFHIDSDALLTVEFRENVFLQKGYIRIFKIEYSTDSGLYEMIPAMSDRVQGNGTKTIPIDPEKEFQKGSYYIMIDDNVFGDHFKGFNNTYDWNLSTDYMLDELIPASILGHDVRLTISLPEFYEYDQSGYRGIFVLDAPWFKGLHVDVHKMYDHGKIPVDPVLVTIGPPWEKDIEEIRVLDYVSHYKEFHAYMKREMLPYVSSVYGVDPASRMMAGGSYAGFMTLYSFLQSCIDQDTIFHDFITSSPVYRNYSWLMDPIAAERDSLGKNLACFVAEFDDPGHPEAFAMVNDWVYGNAFTDFNYYSEVLPDKTHNTVSYPAILLGIPILLNMPDPYFEFSRTEFCDTVTTPQPLIRSWPDDGTLSGTGVSGTAFIPANAGIGSHMITYFYNNAEGQEYSSEVELIVENCIVGFDTHELPSITLSPNPASGIVSVRFTLEEDSHIRISLINLLGQESLELIDEKRPFGNQEILLDVSGLKSGLYLLRLETDKISVARLLVD